jgi:hypothetical protein
MTAGGKRAGSGRKKKEETINTGFRLNSKAYSVCKKHYGRKLNAVLNDFIKDLAKQIEEKQISSMII